MVICDGLTIGTVCHHLVKYLTFLLICALAPEKAKANDGDLRNIKDLTMRQRQQEFSKISLWSPMLFQNSRFLIFKLLCKFFYHNLVRLSTLWRFASNQIAFTIYIVELHRKYSIGPLLNVHFIKWHSLADVVTLVKLYIEVLSRRCIAKASGAGCWTRSHLLNISYQIRLLFIYI